MRNPPTSSTEEEVTTTSKTTTVRRRMDVVTKADPEPEAAPTAAEVATVELLVAHDLLSSQIFTRKVGSVIASSLPKLVSAAALAAPGVI